MKPGQISHNPHPLVQKPSLIVILFACCFAFWFSDFWKPINENTFKEHPEVFERYSYLPAIFFNASSLHWPQEIVSKFSVDTLSSKSLNYNYGSALLNSPFFLIAWAQCSFYGEGPNSGFADAFLYFMHWGSLLYSLFALIFLRKFLINYFSETIVALTLFAIFFGTSLFYYTYTLNELPESQLFFLCSFFLYLTHQYQLEKNIKTFVLLCITISLISLIRWFDVYIVFVLLFWKIKSFSDLKSKFYDTQSLPKLLLIFLFCFFLIWLPQFVLNIFFTNNLFHSFSQIEIYDFADSRIGSVLFNYQNGWLTYSPILLLALFGLFFMQKTLPLSKTIFILILFIVITIYGASTDWRISNYFGARRMCTSAVWLSIPMASFLQKIFLSKNNSIVLLVLKFILICSVFSSFCLTTSQTYLTITKQLQPNKMGEKKYWEIFRKFKF